MAYSPKRPCLQPGCSEYVAKGYCAAHQTAAQVYDRARGTAAARGYGGAWLRVRAEVLKRDARLCQPCRRTGKLVAATEVDHIAELADGGARLDKRNLESTCHSCHVAKTWRRRKARTGGA